MDRRDFLARADLLAACGMTVLISDYFEYYRLAAYLALRTTERLGIVMGVPSLIELFDEKYYAQLPGGILESFGRLFKNDLKIYVYPLQRSDDEELQTVENLAVASELRPCTTTSPCGAVSSSSTTTVLNTSRSSAGMCSSGSRPATPPGRRWCPGMRRT